MRTLVFATNNAHKLHEARQILAPCGFEVLSLSDIGLHAELPETHDTLRGNALEKACEVKRLTGRDCFADDTGLMVDALDGAPGVLSARYAGPACSPADNVRLLLRNMEGADDRRARFVTEVALLLDGQTLHFTGTVEGEITLTPAGEEGFGYDPVFRPEGYDRTFAQMSAELKNSLSHRGRALQAMALYLNQSNRK